ncbi:MAG: thiol oxidoreductase [Deltaproteobacteria bacterium]|nr:thiol oxidoreductase [Deltaproteobacteria bacterium]
MLRAQTLKVLFAVVALGSPAAAQTPRAGGPVPGLSSDEQDFFQEGMRRFVEFDSVLGTEPGATGAGLGPRFNLNSCVACHAQPTVGGSGPAVNPAIAMATAYGATNTVPYFLKSNGPIREARFKYKPDGSRDGGVHNFFVITGRADAQSCNIAQPDFAAEGTKGNLSFRIPTPVFGGGLIDAIEDSTILANKNARLAEKQALGIGGHENRSGNDGTITRFGWKAQNKSLLLFAGEAYNVEQGVTNELFPAERDETPGCVINGTPEDHTNTGASTPTAAISSLEGFAQFMSKLAPPEPAAPTASSQRGSALFARVGCALCHTSSLTTGPASTAALSQKPANLFSDLIVHHMGPGLADDIIQGVAGPDEFRTAPLWGVGQRLFFLHDGRTNDLLTAIEQHASGGRSGDTPELSDAANASYASEANAVIANFNQLAASEKNDLLNFLKSL